MEEPECKSEVALLMRQIELEYQAAERVLKGLALGTAKHEYITARMERMDELHNQLKVLVGEEEAVKAVAEAWERA